MVLDYRFIKKTNNMNTLTREIIIPKIKEYFVTQPVTRAWLFGSFSRGEETDKSDVDILVDFDKDARIGLFKYAGMYGDLKELLGREVDLVQNGALKPFAVESAERDKILIYERAN
jgi:predicted nucleotidyltransferase